jgi:hypothetical protein
MPLRMTRVLWRCSSVSRIQRWSFADGLAIDGRGGERVLWCLLALAWSLHDLLPGLSPFRQPQEAGQRDYGCLRDFL